MQGRVNVRADQSQPCLSVRLFPGELSAYGEYTRSEVSCAQRRFTWNVAEVGMFRAIQDLQSNLEKCVTPNGMVLRPKSLYVSIRF